MSGVTQSTVETLEARCEVCEGPLCSGDAMKIDGVGNEQPETACAGCCRRVCDNCTMSGNEKICLGCAASVGLR